MVGVKAVFQKIPNPPSLPINPSKIREGDKIQMGADHSGTPPKEANLSRVWLSATRSLTTNGKNRYKFHFSIRCATINFDIMQPYDSKSAAEETEILKREYLKATKTDLRLF